VVQASVWGEPRPEIVAQAELGPLGFTTSSKCRDVAAKRVPKSSIQAASRGGCGCADFAGAAEDFVRGMLLEGAEQARAAYKCRTCIPG
jgi:hypothetical protein